MQEEKIEKILQEQANQTEIKPFNEVWQDIKGEIVKESSQQTEKKVWWKKWLPLSLASIAIVIAIIILLPVLLRTPNLSQEEVFYTDELTIQQTSVDNTLNGLSQANINYVDLSNYNIYDSLLYLSEDNKVKGARIKLYTESPLSFFAEMQIYASDVDLGLEIEKDYDTDYKPGSLTAYYKLKDASAEYIYNIYAQFNNVQYVIEYTSSKENVLDFFTVFFK